MVLQITVQHYAVESGTHVCNSSVMVVLRFFECPYIVEVFGLWGCTVAGSCECGNEPSGSIKRGIS
jgi:hypothetical protein